MFKLIFRALFAFAIAWMLIPHAPGCTDKVMSALKQAVRTAQLNVEKVEALPSVKMGETKREATRH